MAAFQLKIEMSIKTILVIICLCIEFVSSHSDTNVVCKDPQCKTIDLSDRSSLEISVKPLASGSQKLVILCYPGQTRAWHRLWANPKFTSDGSVGTDAWDVFYGSNVSEVVERSQSASLLVWPQVSVLLTGQHVFDPFNSSCIGVSSTQHYTLHYTLKNPEWRFVLYTVLGVILFLSAPAWSRSVALHYSAGVSFGVIGSVLVVIFILNRFVPQRLKFLSYTAAAMSASAAMFLMKFFYASLQNLIINHWQALLGYVSVAAVVSFGVVYRWGPVTDPRSLDLIKWLMQALGLVLIYQGCQIPEMAVAIIACTLAFYFFPRGTLAWLDRFRYRYFHRYFPAKKRLLTMEEYERQGHEETERALKELREFCASPDCNAWRTISRLQSPSRFASFMDDGTHLLDDECLEHDTTAEVNPLDLGDSSDESELSFRMGTK